MEPEQFITQIRLMTHKFRPYLARLIYSMPLHPRPGIGTLAVDQQGRCYYDPAYLSTLTVEQGAYILVHEALHVLLRHAHQMQALLHGSTDPFRRFCCNVAIDLVVEQLLRGGMEKHMPPGGVKVEDLGLPPNLSAHEYFRLIEERFPQIKKAKSNGNGNSGSNRSGRSDRGAGDSAARPGQNDSAGDNRGGLRGRKPGPPQGAPESAGDSDPDAGQSADGPRQNQPAQGSGDPAESDCSGGSCGDGVPRPYEEPPDPTWDSYREDQAFVQVEQAIEQHEKVHGIGSVPGQLKLSISGKLRPQPNPWDVLRSAVSSSVSTPVGAPEMTYRRFSRRQQPDLPRLKGRINSQPSAVVILDTSGSMCSGEDQAKALTVIAQGLARLSSFRVFAGDTRICSDKRVSALSQIEWAGGGGTDMARLIDEVDRKYSPDSIVLVTDGYTPWPKRKPRARVVVALTQDKGQDFPAWARGIEVGKKN